MPNKYHYTKLPGKSVIYRPYILIRLSNPINQKQTPSIRALIDSGADICLASQELAIWLGVKFSGQEETTKIMTANGSITLAARKKVILHFQNKQIICPVYFAQKIPADSTPLLGQLGFFDHFHICFNLANKYFQINS